MTGKPKSGAFTGKHMAAVMIAGFGIVAAVNFTMASYAVGGFHGVVVENSYVASQKFNGWLDEAEAMKKLGWSAKSARDADGFVTIESKGAPSTALVSAELRRPIGEHKFASLAFEQLADGTYRSTEPVAHGRWTMRLSIEADGREWIEESELP